MQASISLFFLSLSDIKQHILSLPLFLTLDTVRPI